MNLHEFELRYRAYQGLDFRFQLGRTSEIILELAKLTDKGILTKVLQETSPMELKEITLETYTPYKKKFIEDHKDIPMGDGKLPEYIDRLEYELKVIKEMGFNSYFLIVSDFVGWAKKNSIVVGPGRGSGAGSLLAWVIRITEVDPLPFALLFERFLNPARISMPDFDIDFEDTLREQVITYVREKYGADKVSSIGTYMQLAPKAAFKDVARVVGVPFEKSNQISALMPEKLSLLDAISSPDTPEELKQIYEGDEKVKQAAELASKIEGNMRQLGMHACGVIIAPEKITTYTPIQYVKENETVTVTQYDGPSLETIGLLKMDFLGLRNLSVIKNCIKILQKKYEKEGKELPKMFSFFLETMSFNPPLQDEETFKKVFQAGDTTGIFQFESDGMRMHLIRLQADRIDDLVAMNALYRPGPMEFIPNYIARKRGEEPITYMAQELRDMLTKLYGEVVADEENRKLIEDLGPIMNLTYGIAVYQEQLMFLVQSMAGFSLGEADLLRRGIGKKKKEVIEQLKKEFVKRSEEYKQYKKETSTYIYEKMIEPAASYSFNKSHSVCYALIAYQTAYLKAHHPVEFYAALMRSVEEDTDELSNYIYETQSHGFKVQNPDINESFNHIAAIGEEIRLGFFCIKGVGLEIGETIQKEREKAGKFTSLENFITRCQSVINKKSLEGLVKSGGLDSFGDRKTLLENSEIILQWAKSSPSMSGGLFGMVEMVNTISFKKVYQTDFMEKLMMEQEVFKSFVSGHPLDGLYLFIKKYGFISLFKGKENVSGPVKFIGYIRNIQRAKKKGFFVQIEDISGTIELFMKDTVDFKKFDILIISGFKGGRSLSVDKIVRTSRALMIQQAGGKYDPEMTVVKAKALRAGESGNKPAFVPVEPVEEPEDTSDSESIPVAPKAQVSQHQPETILQHNPDHNPDEEHILPLPENLRKINELLGVIRTHPGDIQVTIGKKEASVSPEGRARIKEVYTS